MFSISDAQVEKLAAWEVEQEKIVLERQNAETPYYGCTGGHLTYCFTVSSLGVILVVRHNFNNTEINLTEFDLW